MSSQRRDLQNSLVCATAVLAAVMLAWPFSGLSFDDDWTWALTVKKLFETGRLTYNGWSSPPVIAQAYWGLLWVKVFGFSFNVLRISTLPIAFGAVMMTYLVARQAKLSAPLAVFSALLTGLSPVFIPLAASFMTDVPGLFFILLSIYALTRGFETPAVKSAVGWLIIGAIAALVGGSSRQIVWVVTLGLLPYLAWLRRADRAFLIVSVAGWMLVFAGAVVIQHWFGLQPYSVPDPPSSSYLRAIMKNQKLLVHGLIWVVLTLVLLTLPLASLSLRRLRGADFIWANILFVAISAAMGFFHLGTAPWMGNVITQTGSLGSIELSGDRAQVLTHKIRIGISFVVILLLSTQLACATRCLALPKNAWLNMKDFFLKPPRDNISVPSLLITFCGLMGLELTRCVSDVAYDRHLLPFIPLLGIPLLVWHQSQGQRKIPLLAWMLLGVSTWFAIANTQEVNSLARARVIAVERLKNFGIADSQIEAGFEYDYWLQACTAGHINDARLLNPPGSYQSDKGPTPSLLPLYRLERNPTSKTAITQFDSVDYFSLLPPFRRRIFIDRFIDPWWLDPARAATQPVPRQIIPQVLLQQYRRDSQAK